MQPESAEKLTQQMEQLQEQLSRIDMKMNSLAAIELHMNDTHRKLTEVEQRLAQNIRDLKNLHLTMMQLVTFFSGQSGPRH